MKSMQPWLYGGFFALGTYFAIRGQFLDAATQWGIALAFDPHNSEVTWKERPRWQRLHLIAHLALVAATFGLGMGLDDAA